MYKWSEIFDYKDGELYWKSCDSNNVNFGDIAGCLDSSTGYKRINIKRKCFYVHRIIWEMFNGVITGGMLIDHVNQNRSDNRIENLRLATKAQNSRNNKAKGFYWDSKNEKFASQITLNGKGIRLGRFDCMIDARAAYLRKRKELFGEFA